MSAEFKAYIVVSPLPIVIEDDSGSTSYNPGDIFEALDNNVSVVRHLALNKIVETTGVPFTGGIFVSQGDPGPISADKITMTFDNVSIYSVEWQAVANGLVDQELHQMMPRAEV